MLPATTWSQYRVQTLDVVLAGFEHADVLEVADAILAQDFSGQPGRRLQDLVA